MTSMQAVAYFAQVLAALAAVLLARRHAPHRHNVVHEPRAALGRQIVVAHAAAARRRMNDAIAAGVDRHVADAAVVRERLPNAGLDVLEAGHCVWEERAPEFESIVTHWVSGAFGGSRSRG